MFQRVAISGSQVIERAAIFTPKCYSQKKKHEKIISKKEIKWHETGLQCAAFVEPTLEAIRVIFWGPVHSKESTEVAARFSISFSLFFFAILGFIGKKFAPDSHTRKMGNTEQNAEFFVRAFAIVRKHVLSKKTSLFMEIYTGIPRVQRSKPTRTSMTLQF